VDLGNGIVVAAIVAVNAAGQPFNPDTCELYAAYLEMGNEFGDYRKPKAADCADSGFGSSDAAADALDEARSLNTTIGLVATNFPMTKAQAQKMAGVAHDGMARAIRPVHTLFDGDTVFALSTGKGQITSECTTAAVFPADTACTLLLNDIYSAGADAFGRAVAHAMLNAKSTHGLVSYCDEFPTACGQAAAGPGTTPGGGGGTGVIEDIDNRPDSPAPVVAPPVAAPRAGALANAGMQVTAMILLGLTSVATGVVLVRQRRWAS
jgi:L-aminopeptidase/D-esterase-like protein